MTPEWQAAPFRAFMVVPPRNGIHKGLAHQGTGSPVIKMGEVYGTNVIVDRDRDRLELTREEAGRFAVDEGDLLFCRTSLVPDGVGHCALVGQLSERTVFASNLIRIRLDRDQASSRFWHYYFRSPVGKGQLLSLARGTSVTTITGPDIADLQVMAPTISEQRAIAHVLGALDDKMQLDQRMNETLESMARSLFISWFVDFGPVRAKVEGRHPGLPAEVAGLFPSGFQESRRGEIPAGWTCVPFSETVDIIGGGTPKTSVSLYWDGDVPWFSVVDAPRGSDVWVVETKRTITQAGIDTSSAKVLPVGTTIISARGTVGRTGLVGVPMAMNQSCYGLRGEVGTEGFFTYYLTRELVGLLQQRAHGSVFDTITRDTLAGVYVAVPPPQLVSCVIS